MRFTPLTEQDIQESLLMSEGTYDFQIISAEDKTSKSGNEMIALKLKVWDMNGKEHVVFDYILEAMKFKLRHFCEVAGLIEKYNNGTITAHDCEGKSGKVEIIVQPAEGSYAAKNSVKDYVVSKSEPTKTSEEFFNDDLPF